MNQIKKLEIVGFKSFCDRTQILFHEGITSIVGPNGCGKSNIADAISWVVGEQSAKSLRTDRMEGVIFNGTQARKPTSLAEVVLTLSLLDSQRVPDGMDLNSEEFTVSRRLYRSGESEYFLDGRRCRLKDIQALFEGTGLGPNSYALIEQGRIGQILSSRPADRRALIEEAARITLFKSRRYSAEMKLEMAQQNLLRVNDIIREVTRQLNSLRRQAAKARRYARLREELRGVYRLKLGMENRDLGSRLAECRSRLAAAKERERAIMDDLESVEQGRVAGQEACSAQEAAVDRVRDRLGVLRVEAGNTQSLLQSQESQREHLLERSLELEREQSALEERSRLVQREQERLTNASGLLDAEISREQASLESEQSRREVLREALRQTENEIDETRSSLLSDAGRLSDLKNMQVRYQESFERIRARTERLESERRGKSQEREALAAELEDCRRQLSLNASRQDDLAGLHTGFAAREQELADSLERVTGEMNAQQEEFSLMQHRFSSLEEVERRRSNYSEGVQKFLAADNGEESTQPAHTLADYIETDPLYEKAVEDYLNDPLQYILVDGIQDAVQNVDRLKRIGAGRCTFMTLRNGHNHGSSNSRMHLDGEGVIGYLDELLRMREEVRHAFERALPEFASTVMVSDLSTAFRLAENCPTSTSFLTLAGESYSPRGTLSAVGERKSMAGFLALKREKRELEAKLSALRGKIAVTREELSRLKTEQASVAESIKSLAGEMRKIEVDALVVRHSIDHLETEIARIDQAESVASSEINQLLIESAEFSGKADEAAQGIADTEADMKKRTAEMRECNARLESLKVEIDELAKTLAQRTSAHAVRVERRNGIESELGRLAGEAEEIRRKMEAQRAEQAGAQQRLEQLDQAQVQTRFQLEQLTAEIEVAETDLGSQQRALAVERERLAELEGKIRSLHSDREQALEARGRIEIEETRMQSDIEHLERVCMEEFHAPLQTVEMEIAEADWQRDAGEVAQSYNQLRDRVEGFGAINMRALEEYQQLDERYQFLDKQRGDIERSIADTQRAISEINRRSLEQFQDAFVHIRENFKEVFEILFKGGQCDLRLLDDEDVLESGIDIVAQPPGKRLQNVLLLSGGEKALTALALLIAIFRYRPSPFCVLDEVDAPLDDVNVKRFTALISELSRETQFIIITHNKMTMEVSQTIYGVTMEEPGVSKILGVDFRRREALAS